MSSRDRVPELLRVLAQLPDHEPIAHTLRVLVAQGGLSAPATVEALRAVFATLPDTGLQRIVRGFDRVAAGPSEPLVDCVVDALQRLPLKRLPAVCLLDRWLKNTDPAARTALDRAALEAIGGRLEAAECDRIEDTALVRLPGVRFAELDALAESRGCAAAWQARLEVFADRVVALLQIQPRSLSQANAEEILARRVYTDPGHFIVELLQNAEDAGARRFELHVDNVGVSVWHDGAPFDARDVVGVLSIGQTTKAQDQIGFFGVGFKSVYEICERPQVHSRLFSFEIADVSIPRRLSARPRTPHPEGGTLLMLPFRGSDVEPERLHRRALAVPPQTLLTLSNLRALRVSCGDSCRTIEVLPGGQPGHVRLEHRESGDQQLYLVTSERFAYTGGRRERTKASETDVLIAITLDPEGRPVPCPPDAATVFSYLPTRERAGLRFLVHAHFDLPVDRERLDLESPWNRWALACAGRLLARAVQRLTTDSGGDSQGRLGAILDVLPLREELSHPAYCGLTEAFREEVASIDLLEGAAGEHLRPQQAMILEDPQLAGALAGVILEPEGRRALRPLSTRRARVAHALGATSFGVDALVDLLARHLAPLQPGEPWPTAWLAAGIGGILDALGRSLPAGAGLDRLAALPVLPDQEQRPRRPHTCRRASPALRQVYGRARVLLAAALDLEPSADQDSLLRRLGVAQLTAEDLLGDLKDGPRRGMILAEAGASGLHAYLAGLPSSRLAGLCDLPLFPDELGAYRPLSGDEAVLCSPSAPFAAFLRAMTGTRAALIERDFERDFGPYLRGLGARIFDLQTLLGGIRDSTVALTAADVSALHRLLDGRADDLTPRACDLIARSAIFPDRDGQLRALVGADRGLVAADPDVRVLAPGAPWLDPEVAAMRHLERLPVRPIGPVAVVESLLLRGDLVLIDPFDPAELRRAYVYLIAHAEALPETLLEALADAPLWFDGHGERHPITALRRAPADPGLVELYRAWRGHPVIEEDGPSSALALALALGLGDGLRETSHALLVRDLVVEPEASAAIEGPLRPLLLRELRQAAGRLSHQELSPLSRAPIFATTEAERRPLGQWSEPPSHGAHRADGVLRDVLSEGSRALIDRRDEADLSMVLEALSIPVADGWDLVGALETDPRLSTPEIRQRCRRALVAVRDSLRIDPVGGEPGTSSARLSALPLWPSTDGRSLPATAVVRGVALREALGAGWLELEASEEAVLLDPAADADAEVLADLFRFRSPLDLVVEQVRTGAREGAPLAEQPLFLRTRARVLSLLDVIRRHGGEAAGSELALTVDADGCLVRGSRLGASPDELALARGLPLFSALADSAWGVEAARIAPERVPPLPPSRLIVALLEVSRTPTSIAEHPVLTDRGRRTVLYRWLQGSQGSIEADPHARGPLGRANVILTRGDRFRAPQELLLFDADDAMPEHLLETLGLFEWCGADEVPAALLEWFQGVYRLAETRLEHLVGALIQAHRAVRQSGDVARSATILRVLSRTLCRAAEEGDLHALVRRHRVHRMRVATERCLAGKGGDPPASPGVARKAPVEFERARDLLIPGQARWPLIQAFMSDPPARVSSAYDSEETRAVLLAAGATPELSTGRLATLLSSGEGRREGPIAALALARYVAERVAEEPALYEALSLERTRWIPDGAGTSRAPGALYWPAAETEVLIGDSPGHYPHPGFFRTVPETLSETLPFRHAQSAAPADVLKHLRSEALGLPLASELLAWLEAALIARRIEPRQVRRLFGRRPMLADDEGTLRWPSALICVEAQRWFGARRGTWPEGKRYSKLAATLKIPGRVGPDEVLAFGEELAQVLEGGQDPGSLLASEPELARCLPRCLSLLGAQDSRKAPPFPRMPLIALDEAEEPRLCLLNDPRLVLPLPPELAEAARERQLPMWIPDLASDGQHGAVDWLRRSGVSTLGDRFRPAPFPAVLPGDVTSRHRPAVAQLEEDLHRALGELEVRIIEGLVRSGTLTVAGGSARVSVPVPWVVDTERARLLLTPDALSDRDAVLQALTEADVERRRTARARSSAPAPTRHDKPAAAPQPKHEENTATHEKEEQSGLWSNVKRWFGERNAKEEQEEQEEREEREEREEAKPVEPRPQTGHSARSSGPSAQPPALPDHSRWFRPAQAIQPQLHGNGSSFHDRHRPRFGFTHAPKNLAAPYLYAPQCISSRFRRRTQRWLAVPHPPEWRAAAAEGKYRYEVALEGRLPPGQSTLPLPMYSRVLAIDASAQVAVLAANTGEQVAIAEEETDITVRLVLGALPVFGSARSDAEPPKELLRPTVKDAELPLEVLEWLLDVQSLPHRPIQRALATRDFIRERYRYDPTYLEDPAVARWLHQITHGRANTHLAALHAGRDSKHLGRGVCYELNVLACELMRRLEVPAAIAQGWTYDRGSLAAPDHLWAMALLPTDVGPRWLPIDASTTRDGRPLHLSDRPRGPWRVRPPRQQSAPPKTPSWEASSPRAVTSSRPSADRGHTLRRPEPELARVMRYVAALAGEPLDDTTLRRRAEAILSDPEAARRLLRHVIEGEG